MKSIWQKLKKPILILAPMEDVTDTVFRQIIVKCGKPDLFYTEFTSVDGLFSQGYEYVAKRLKYTDVEKPLIAQIWGKDPQNYFKAAKMLFAQGFDGIDINMGCPQRNIISQGVCSALIKNKPLAEEIIQATKEGAQGKIPVSVKTRIGFNEIQTEEWAGFLLEQKLDALIVHGRTAREMSKVPAHWDEIGKVVKIRNKIAKKTLIIGNGDIETRQEALEMSEKYQLDGIMIGRGIFKDPWLFNEDRNGTKITFSEKVNMLIEHVSLFESTWGGKKHFPIMKKFFKCYIQNHENAAKIREDLMQYEEAEDVKNYLQKYL